jgi:ferredoxin-NADP reductase
MKENNYQQLRITAIVEETANAKTFVLQPLNNWQPVAMPGQFLTLVFISKHAEKRRSYSISSLSVPGGPLSITIKKVDNGEFSRLLLQHAKAGDTLSCSGSSGFFLLPKNINTTGQYFFLAAGSGITPCYAMIKTLLHTSNKKVVLIYSNRSESDAIFLKQIQALQQQFNENFIVHWLFSNRNNVFESRLSNWLLQQLLGKYLSVPKEKVLFYLCGPFEYMQMATITLLNEGIAQQNIRKENFNALPRITRPVPPDINPHNVTVSLNGDVYNIAVQYPQTILAAAKANNISIPFSCEAGRCGSCAALCTKGKTWMAYNEVLMDEEIEKGMILCCQAFPVEGDVAIRL